MCEHILVTPLGINYLNHDEKSSLAPTRQYHQAYPQSLVIDHKVLEAYHKEVNEIFLSRYEVT
jgi:hypothetical protein